MRPHIWAKPTALVRSRPENGADFILVAANPLDDVRNAAQVRGVFTHAKWHSDTELEARLAQVKEHSVSDQ